MKYPKSISNGFPPLLPGEQEAVDEIVERHKTESCSICHNKNPESHALAVVLGRRYRWTAGGG